MKDLHSRKLKRVSLSSPSMKMAKYGVLDKMNSIKMDSVEKNSVGVGVNYFLSSFSQILPGLPVPQLVRPAAELLLDRNFYMGTPLLSAYEKPLVDQLAVRPSTRKIAIELSNIPEISVFGDPEKLTNVVAFTTNDFDIYEVNSELKDKGWNLNPLQFPSSLHLCVTEANSSPNNVESFIEDVKSAVEKCRNDYSGVSPQDGGSIYGTSQKITNRSLVGSVAKIYLDALYFTN